MSFDMDRLFSFVCSEVARFSETHRDETFYGFAIDAALLCFNSEECFQKSLASYQNKWEQDSRVIAGWDELTERDLSQSEYLLELTAETEGLDLGDRAACLKVINDWRVKVRAKGNPYLRKDRIKGLRYNTGDWAYQGFATMTDEVGFDDAAYAKHYDMSERAQRVSRYGRAMDELVARAKKDKIFASLKRAPGFRVFRVEHDY